MQQIHIFWPLTTDEIDISWPLTIDVGDDETDEIDLFPAADD